MTDPTYLVFIRAANWLVRAAMEKSQTYADFRWTSLQVNIDSVSADHQDVNNVGPSFIAVMGDCAGGDFHSEQPRASPIGPGTRSSFSMAHSPIDRLLSKAIGLAWWPSATENMNFSPSHKEETYEG